MDDDNDTMGYKDIALPFWITPDIVRDFNMRLLTVDNINDIISLYDYLLISNKFLDIFKYITPDTRPYVLGEYNRKYHKIPLYMKKLSCENCAKYNNMQWLKFAYIKRYKLCSSTFYYAIYNDNVEMVNYLRMNKCPEEDVIFVTPYTTEKDLGLFRGRSIMDVATRYKSFNVFKYLYSCKKYKCEEKTFYLAAIYCTDIFKYLHKQKHEITKQHIKVAIENNNLECVNYILSIEPYLNFPLCDYASKNHDTEILEVLISLGYRWTINAVYDAIRCDNINYIKKIGYISKSGFRSNIYQVLNYDSIEIFKYYHENGKIQMDEIYNVYSSIKTKCLTYICQHVDELSEHILENYCKMLYEHEKISQLKIIIDHGIKFKVNRKRYRYLSRDEKKLFNKMLRDNDCFNNA